MRDIARLQLVARVTYYFGWIALLCGGLVQVNIARALFVALSINKRNLFELGVVCFLICMASELRVLANGKSQVSSGIPSIVKKQVAA
jgi:hypothetical protein